MTEIEKLRARITELEKENEDLLTGRMYGGGREARTGVASPIDMLGVRV